MSVYSQRPNSTSQQVGFLSSPPLWKLHNSHCQYLPIYCHHISSSSQEICHSLQTVTVVVDRAGQVLVTEMDNVGMWLKNVWCVLHVGKLLVREEINVSWEVLFIINLHVPKPAETESRVSDWQNRTEYSTAVSYSNSTKTFWPTAQWCRQPSEKTTVICSPAPL